MRTRSRIVSLATIVVGVVSRRSVSRIEILSILGVARCVRAARADSVRRSVSWSVAVGSGRSCTTGALVSDSLESVQ